MAAKLLCVVRDRVADAIGPVMVFAAVPAAVRLFSDLALDPGTMVHRHPADFELLHVASIDESTGEVAAGRPVVLLTGEAWLAAQEPREKIAVDQLSLLKEA